MSQSILEYNIENNYYKIKQDLMDFAEKENLKVKFMVGEGADRDRVRHTQMFREAIDTDNCEIIDYLNEKIKSCGTKKCKKKSIEHCGDLEININYGEFWSTKEW